MTARNTQVLVIDIDEQQVALKMEGTDSVNWFLDLTAADEVSVPYTTRLNEPHVR